MNKYLALLLITLSSSAMAFNDDEDFSKLFFEVGYSWVEPLYVDGDFDLDTEISSVFSLGYKVDDASWLMLSHQDVLSYTSISYKRSITKWAFDEQRFVPYFSVGLGMGSDEVGDADINVFGVTGSFGVDYRVNSYVELTASVSLTDQSFEMDSSTESISTYGISNSANFGVRIYPF
ncbi:MULTISPECIES: hypothetical protein [Vibrio]|uniref:hypothetical protein n=1 Tax=Vibrio TaxID=662 RepID=UPI0011AEF8A2|nr:hypothetical protein [Vibrio diazotrophicus]